MAENRSMSSYEDEPELNISSTFDGSNEEEPLTDREIRELLGEEDDRGEAGDIITSDNAEEMDPNINKRTKKRAAKKIRKKSKLYQQTEQEREEPDTDLINHPTDADETIHQEFSGDIINRYNTLGEDIGFSSNEEFESYNPIEKGFYDSEQHETNIKNIGGIEDLQNRISNVSSRQIPSLNVPYDSAEIISSSLNDGKIFANTKERPASASLHQDITGSMIDSVIYDGADVLTPSQDSLYFDSRSEESILQPEPKHSDNTYIKETAAYTKEETSHIISKTHNDSADSNGYFSSKDIYNDHEIYPNGTLPSIQDNIPHVAERAILRNDSFQISPLEDISPINPHPNVSYIYNGNTGTVTDSSISKTVISHNQTYSNAHSVGNIGNKVNNRHAVIGKTTTGSSSISPDSHLNTTERAEGNNSSTDSAQAGKEQLISSRKLESKVKKDLVSYSNTTISLMSRAGRQMMSSYMRKTMGAEDEDMKEGYRTIDIAKDIALNVNSLGYINENGIPLLYMGLRAAVTAINQRQEAIEDATEKLGDILNKYPEINASILSGSHHEVMQALKKTGIRKDNVENSLETASEAVNKAKAAINNAKALNDENALRLANNNLRVSQKKLSDAKKLKEEYLKEQKAFRLISKRRKDIHDTVSMQTYLLNRARLDTGIFTEKQLQHLQSRDFINGAIYNRQNMAVVNAYFKHHPNEMFRKVSPSRMSVKDLKKMLKKKDKLVITASDQKVLNYLIGLKRISEAKRLTSLKNKLIHGTRKVRTLAGLSIHQLEGDPSIKTATTTYRAGRVAAKMLKFSWKAGIRTIRFAGRITGASFVAHIAGKHLRRKFQTVRNISKAHVKTAKTALRHRVKSSRTGKYVSRKIGQAKRSSFVKTTSKAMNNIRNKVHTVSSGVKKGKRATRKIRSVVSKPFHILLAPFRLFNVISSVIGKMLFAIGLLFLGIVIVFLALLIIINALFFVGSESTMTFATTTMLTNDDMRANIEYLNNLNDEKYSEAIAVAKGTPLNPQVFGGEKIYHYGSPESRDDPNADIYHNDIPGSETDNGYHIYFIDANGNIIGSNTTNTKDIICLASVMFSNQLYPIGSDDLLNEYSEVVEKWADLLNPEVIYLESDIYHAEGSDVYPHGRMTSDQDVYYCNDASFYTEYENIKHESVNGQQGGVKFYNEPHEQTVKGCQFDYSRFSSDYTNWQSSEPYPPDEPDWDDYVYMEEPDYRDYIDSGDFTYYSELYWSLVDDYYESYDRYLNEYNRYLTNHDIWEQEEPDPDEYWYCPGHPLHEGTVITGYHSAVGSYSYGGEEEGVYVSYGYKDINIFVPVLTKDDVYEAFASNNGIIAYKVPTEYDLTSWETKTIDVNLTQQGYEELMQDFLESDGWKNPVNTGWCDAMYDLDWYDTFGVDVYSDSVGLNNGSGGLSPRQIQELMDSYDGNLSASREEFVEYALTYVGQIDYYYGGKPKAAGWAGNGFGERTIADSKGRSLRGLDCSGFVSWVYWSVFGVKPGTSTGTFAPSLHLSRISADRLVPGDIGYMNLPGSTAGNHMGIFVGYDDTTGKPKWVHCVGLPTNTVVCNTTNAFRYYYSLGR